MYLSLTDISRAQRGRGLGIRRGSQAAKINFDRDNVSFRSPPGLFRLLSSGWEDKVVR